MKIEIEINDEKLNQIIEEEVRKRVTEVSDSINNYGYASDLLKFDYCIDEMNKRVILRKYIGDKSTFKLNKSKIDLTIYAQYCLNNRLYQTALYDGAEFFKDAKNIKQIIFEEGIDCSELTRMNYMFENCTSLTRIINLRSLDLSNVTCAIGCFKKCKSFMVLMFPKLDLSKVETFAYAFEGCKRLEGIDVSFIKFNERVSTYKAFLHCPNFKRLLVGSEKARVKAVVGALFDNDDKVDIISIKNNLSAIKND